MTLRDLASISRRTISEWLEHKAFQMAAALAYYSLFSIAPLLLIAIAIAGLVFDGDAARVKVVDEVRGLMGAPGALGVEQMLESASESSGLGAGLVGLAALLFGASGVFTQLKEALNTIWEVEPKSSSFLIGLIRDRLLSFSMVLVIGFLLLVSLVVSTVVSAMGAYFQSWLPGGEIVWQAVNFALSVGTITVLFALIFRFVPDTGIAWRDVWTGAAVSAALFTLGKTLIGLYLGKSAVASSFGAAGSLVIVLVWVYYSALLVLLGAEFTHVQARHLWLPAEGGERDRSGAPGLRRRAS